MICFYPLLRALRGGPECSVESDSPHIPSILQSYVVCLILQEGKRRGEQEESRKRRDEMKRGGEKRRRGK